MWRRIFIAIAALLSVAPAYSQVNGVNVQVSNGKPVPTQAQLESVLNRGDFVRDVLGWHKADPHCNLRTDPALNITIPNTMLTLYTRVEAAGGKNFVTLGFNNTNCGQSTNSGANTFPNTDALRAEFAAYAVSVVRQVPAIGGISIWNELNGTWDGGYSNESQQLTDYCLLTNAVVTEVRKVDANIPIAIGATIGWKIDDWFIGMFDKYGCVGKGDPTIWLDVHPYLTWTVVGGTHKTDWALWKLAINNVRADGINNPLIASEWGAKAAYSWSQAHPSGDYMTLFQSDVLSPDSPWGGAVWFEMLYDSRSPNAGLFNKSGTLTVFGTQYIDTFDN